MDPNSVIYKSVDSYLRTKIQCIKGDNISVKIENLDDSSEK